MNFVLHVLFHAETTPERVAMLVLMAVIVAAIIRFLRFLFPGPVKHQDGPESTAEAIRRGMADIKKQDRHIRGTGEDWLQ